MIASAEEFARLRTSDKREEYERAINDSASEAVWREVIAAYPAMRVWVARNKTVPNNVLAILASDPDPLVRSAVADVRRVSSEVLERLARDADASVRLRVAFNGKVPKFVLQLLLHDDWDRVSEVARQRLIDS